MSIEKIIQIAKDRNEINFLFNITKQIAESDSIGEEYGYCCEYTRDMFNDAEIYIPTQYEIEHGYVPRYCKWLKYGGIPIYEIYLKHQGIIL